jgi:DNA-binding response OmpR family regulator
VDYIQKPFTFSILTQTLLECLAKLQANGSLLAKINNNLFYNQFSKELIKDTIPINLSKNEIEIFELLLAKGNQIVTYEMLINYLGGEISDNALKNIILRLRKKIGDDTIRNLSKVGYTLLLER